MEFGCFLDVNELCPVCGDKVSGYHYGLLTCESCKGFFKRTVQNKKLYVCSENQRCSIDKTQRKRCPFCRFQKCLNVGMRLEAVRANRMRGGRNKFGPIYKWDRAVKQQRRALIQAHKSTLQSQEDQGLFILPEDHVDRNSSLIPTKNNCMTPSPPLTFIGSSLPVFNQPTTTLPSSANTDNSRSTADSELHSSVLQAPRTSQLMMEFLLWDHDDLQLQKNVTTVLQKELRKHHSLSSFGLMYLVADQLLFSIVEWARNSIFFKQLKVNDQIKLLHSCWAELLVLDIVSRQVLYGENDGLVLVTRQEVHLSDMASYTDPVLSSLIQRGQELVDKLCIIKVKRQEFACIRFHTVFNPEVNELQEHHLVLNVKEQVERALLEYLLCTCPQYMGRFTSLLSCVSELRSLGNCVENYLYLKYMAGEVPCNNLLTEMLQTKYSCA